MTHGLRVGESHTGGDFNGLLANHLSILRKTETGLVTTEAMLEHSKTKFKRFTNSLGTTLGHAAVPVETAIREYWKEAGFSTVSWEEGGYEVTSVDYFVIRVSFLGMTQAKFDLLIKWMSTSGVLGVRRHATTLAHRASQRYTATTSIQGQEVHQYDRREARQRRFSSRV